MNNQNRRIVLASRPHGKPTEDNFRLETTAIPSIQENEVLLRTVFLSLDPYMRGRMSDAKSYADPVNIGEVMVGGVVSQVVESNNPKFHKGDWVLAYTGWQDYAISNGNDLTPLGQSPSHPS